MDCPDEVARVALEIIRNAVLSIRVAGWQHDVEYCALEADHIHNLPSLILSYSKEKLEYYLNIERPCYVDKIKERSGNPEAFRAQWEKLEQFLQTAEA